MPVQTSRRGDVVEVMLGWPAVRNALGPAEARELRLAIEAAAADESVGAIVISAEGDAFCAGGNLPEVARLGASGADAAEETLYREFQGVFRAMRQSPVPMIAAVDGPALGLGCDLAIAGSVTFIGDRGWLRQGWIRVGLVPATGGTLYAAERGGSLAVWRLLAADRVDGPTAEQWGLAIACADARVAAFELAERLAGYPRAALRGVVELTRIQDWSAHLARAVKLQAKLLSDPAFAELAKAAMRS